jgi:transcriptional regulator with XRE-family HTH domain
MSLIELSKQSLPNEFSIETGKAIRDMREKMGFSQAQLAEMIDKRRASISEIENGKMLPDILAILQIAEALGCSVSSLLPSGFRVLVAPDDLSKKESDMLILFRRIEDDALRDLLIEFIRITANYSRR